MKIALTGHTNGLGKAIADTADNVIGFSLSSGYDISNPLDRERIFDESKDCDVFINNAYHETGQIELINLFLERWKGQPKTIVNIGSTIIFTDHSRILFPHLLSYSLAKRAQDELCRKNMLTLLPKVVSIIPGAMNTRMTDYPGAKINKMDVYDAARYILNIIANKNKIDVRYTVIGHEHEANNYDNVLGSK